MGRPATLSQSIRSAIVILKGEGYSNRDIAFRLHISHSAVGRVFNRHLKQGNVIPVKQPGRPRITSVHTDRIIKRLAVKNPAITSNEIAAEVNGAASARTIRRRLHDQFHLKAHRPALKPCLTKKQRHKRLAFCREYSTKTAEWWQENVLFSDEVLFQLQPTSPFYIRRPQYSRFHPRYVRPRFRFAIKLMVWGCISASGVAALTILPRGATVNSIRYIDILEQNLQLSLAWSQTNIFMHDNAPCHASNMTREWLVANHIPTLPWPGNSPDLNPIENVWSRMKAQVRKKNPRTVDELSEMIYNVWHADITPEYCQILIASMPKRLNEVRIRNGGTSHY